jgi:hypothetical protein
VKLARVWRRASLSGTFYQMPGVPVSHNGYEMRPFGDHPKIVSGLGGAINQLQTKQPDVGPINHAPLGRATSIRTDFTVD